ncbi:MAG: DUF996 domain-containing protein [Caldisericia bacterium]
MDLKHAKILGGLGAIFILCFIIPVVGWILSIVGFILTAIAVSQISKTVNEKSIFSNYLISIILYFASIVTSIIGLIGVFAKIVLKNLDKFENLNPDFWNRFNRFGTRNLPHLRDFPQIRELLTNAGGQIWILLMVLAIVWIIILVAGLFTKFSFDKISEKVKINNFKISGLLIFIGSILTILFGVGFIIILIGVIFEIISFFSLPDKYEEKQLT